MNGVDAISNGVATISNSNSEPFVYTEGQSTGLCKLKNFVGSEHPIFLLSGSAGTGKTTIAEGIPSMVSNGRVIGSAPTHKAVGVLQQRFGDTECMTIHKFLGLRPKKVGDKQKLGRKSNYDPSEFYDVRLVVLDEASMVDSELLSYIMQDIDTWQRQYVFIGDQYQLPPVNEIYSPCFTLALPDSCKHELTEIRRHAGPIITLATTIRDAIIQKKQPDVVGGLLEDGTGVRLLRPDAWEKALRACVLNDQFKSNPDFCRVIAWRNQTVMSYNQQIRSMLGEPTDVPFCAGDNLTANEAWTQGDEVLFNTGTEFTVTALEPHQHPAFPQLEGWQVWLEGFDAVPVYVLDILNCGDAYKTQLAKLVDIAKQPGGSWEPFYQLKEFYADLRPLYSITSHKSQGSTFQNVFVDMRDIYRNKIASEADRSLYVSVTRASKNVFVRM